MTRGTVLLVLGVPERTVIVTDPIRRTVAHQVGGLLWAGEEGSDGRK